MRDYIAFLDAHGGGTAFGVDLGDDDATDIGWNVVTLAQGGRQSLHGDASDEFADVFLRCASSAGTRNGTCAAADF